MLGAEVVCGIKSGFDWWAKVSRSAAHLMDMFMSMECSTRPASAATAAHAAAHANDAEHATCARDLAGTGAPRHGAIAAAAGRCRVRSPSARRGERPQREGRGSGHGLCKVLGATLIDE